MNFLQSYLEKRRADIQAQEDSSETAELLSSINSNIAFVVGSSSDVEANTRQVIGAIQSQTAMDKQRDAVYSAFSQEQIATMKIFADNQLSQSSLLNAALKDLNATITDVLGGQLQQIVEYLKPDTTHSERDALARSVAHQTMPASRASSGKPEPTKKRSIVDDLTDLFGNNSEKKAKTGRTIGSAGQSAGKGSWWDKLKGKIGGIGGTATEAATGVGGTLKNVFSKVPSIATKFVAPVAAALDVGSGVSDLMDGKRQTEMPSGWNMLSPMRWGMYAGEKINQTYEDASKNLGGSGNMVEDGVNSVSAIGDTISGAFKHSIIPGFNTVTNNLGSFADNFQMSAKSLVLGLGDKLSDLGDSLKAGASAAWSGAKRAVSGASNYASDMANKAVQNITGDKAATVGSVTSKLKDKALSFIPGLGGTSAQFESGKAGTKAVGWDQTGGTSYGKYQIASKTGTAQEFLDFVKNRGGNDDIHKTLSEAGFAKDTGSTRGAAVDAWKKLASDQGSSERLSELEHKFIEQKKFMPAYNKAKELGFNTNDVGVQDAIWSASVQHGKVNKEILGKVAADPNFKNMSTEDQIKAIYARRGDYVDGLAGVSKAAGRDRYDKEVQVALAKSEDAKKKGIDGAPIETKAVAANTLGSAKAQPESYASSFDMPTTKVAMQATRIEPEVKTVVKEPQQKVSETLPEEVKPVQVANADQISSKVEVKASDIGANSKTSNTSNTTVPTLDSIPLQITDLGLVLLNIGHV